MYWYQKLESLLQPIEDINTKKSSDDVKITSITSIGNLDFLRLEHISASFIMHDEYVARCFLPLTPSKFFKPLFQVAVFNYFYIDEPEKKLPGSLVQLILHWPYETFVLNDVLPSLPPKKNKNSTEMWKINQQLQTLYEEIIELLPIEVLMCRSDFASTKEWKFIPKQVPGRIFKSKLMKIDVSGYRLNILSKNRSNGSLDLLLGSVIDAYNPDCPLGYDRLQLICDAYIQDSDKELNALKSITEISSRHGAKLVIIFRKLVFDSYISKNKIKSLLNLICEYGTEFLEINFLDIEDEIDDDVISPWLYPQLKGFTLYQRTSFSSLSFLNTMINLEQLYLSQMPLTNKLAHLCCLPKGLKYLKLYNCQLNGEDMKSLKQSHHVKTLLHLEISHNDFALPIDAAGLVGLCQVLESVEILMINYCNLRYITDNLLRILFESLAALPKLSLLMLYDDNSSPRILDIHIISLQKCMSLRCVCLMFPPEMYEVFDDQHFIGHRIKCMKKIINSILNCNRKTVINVLWDKGDAIDIEVDILVN